MKSTQKTYQSQTYKSTNHKVSSRTPLSINTSKYTTFKANESQNLGRNKNIFGRKYAILNNGYRAFETKNEEEFIQAMGLNDEESLEFIKDKLTRDYNELSDELKPLVNDIYSSVMKAESIRESLIVNYQPENRPRD